MLAPGGMPALGMGMMMRNTVCTYITQQTLYIYLLHSQYVYLHMTYVCDTKYHPPQEAAGRDASWRDDGPGDGHDDGPWRRAHGKPLSLRPKPKTLNPVS